MNDNASKILDLLEQRGLLDPKRVAQLRTKLNESGKKVSARKLARLLIDKGMLTSFQAKSLLAEISKETEKGSKIQTEKPAEGDDLTLEEIQSTDELVPLDDDDAAATDDAELQLLDDEDALTPLDDDIASLPPLEEEKEDSVASGSTTAVADGEELVDLGVTQGDTSASTQQQNTESTTGETGLELLDDDTFSPDVPAEDQESKTGRQITIEFFKSQWESPLMLVGGGALIFLTIAGVFLYLYMTRASAEQMFQTAEDQYAQGTYSQAITSYNKFLDRFDSHSKASLARVKIALSRVGREAIQNKLWETALNVAKEELPKIENEKDYAEHAPAELAIFLPEIVSGFRTAAQDAANVGDTETAANNVRLFRESLKMVRDSKYITSSRHKQMLPQIESLEREIEVVERIINQGNRLEQAVQEMEVATAAGDTRQAYEIRRELLKEYPHLGSNEKLLHVSRAISDEEKNNVRVVQESRDAMTEEPLETQETLKRRYVIASRSGEEISSVANHVVYVRAAGAMYALDGPTGQVLWRRYVGAESRHYATPVNKGVGADAIVVDDRRNELLRIRAKTGQVVWRQLFENRLSEPVIAGNRALVASSGGTLHQIDLETGNEIRYATLSQSLYVSPARDSKRPYVYQVSEHSNLYVLSEDSLECAEVHYIGHDPGTVRVQPVVALGHILVAANAGANFAMLHVVATDEHGLELRRAQDSIRLQGHVVVKPIAIGRRVIVMTNLGAIYLFEVGASEEGEAPVTLVATIPPTLEQPMLGYPLSDAGQLWIADNSLIHYEIQASRGEILRKRVSDKGDAFVGPMTFFGDVLFHVRREKGLAGVTVTAESMKNHERFWTTRLGVPAAGEIIFDQESREFITVTAQGDLYRIAPDDLETNAVVSDPVDSVRGKGASPNFHERLDLGDGRIVFVSSTHPEAILLFDPGTNARALKLVELRTTPDDLLEPPIIYQGGLLAGGRIGQVFVFDPLNGAEMIHPFQPRIEVGLKMNWCRGVVSGHDPSEVLIADGRKTLYRLRVEGTPPNLTAVAAVDVDDEVVGPLGAVGNTVYTIVRGARNDRVIAYQTSDLVRKGECELDGRLAWGPFRLGDLILLASDGSELSCFVADQDPKWRIPVVGGQIAGRPILDGTDLIVAMTDGKILRISRETGEEVAQLDVGEPLGTGPTNVDQSTLVITGIDGTIYEIEKP